MEDLDIAYLVLVTASAADGGCRPCIQQCIDEAIHLHPELPFETALDMVRPESTRNELVEAVKSSRSLLADARFPTSSDSRAS